MRIEQQVETYNQNGWVVVEDLLSSEEVAVLSQRADEIILGEKFPEVSVQCVQIEPDMKEQIEAGMIPRTEAIRTLRGVAEHDDLFHTHVRNEKILDIAQAIVGPEVSFLGDLMFNKPALHGSEKLWHQDNRSFGVEPGESLVGCWVALDDAVPENGCMRYIQGSHAWGLIHHEKDSFGSHVQLPVLVKELTERHYVEGVSDPDAASEDELRWIVESAEVVQPVSAGSCLFSSSMVLHSTAPNQSQRRRRSAASWYVNANSRYRNPDRTPEWPRVR